MLVYASREWFTIVRKLYVCFTSEVYGSNHKFKILFIRVKKKRISEFNIL